MIQETEELEELRSVLDHVLALGAKKPVCCIFLVFCAIINDSPKVIKSTKAYQPTYVDAKIVDLHTQVKNIMHSLALIHVRLALAGMPLPSFR